MKTLTLWIEASRPKTLFASLSPVLIAAAFAASQGVFVFFPFLITLLTALGIQVGANFANDYFDFLRGGDTPSRKGPRRLLLLGLVSLSQMRLATFLTFTAVSLLSIYLTIRGGPAIALLSTLSILLAVGYSGGPWPLASKGVSELFVLLFFGPIATAGAAYLQTLTFSWEAAVLGLTPGLLSTAVLAVNNLRDIEEDRKSGKKTLAVRYGKRFTQIEYTLCLVMGCLIPLCLGLWLTAFALIPAVIPLKTVWRFHQEQELNATLAQTGKIGFLAALLIGCSLFIHAI